MRYFIVYVLSLIAICPASAELHPAIKAYQNHDYSQAIQLWNQEIRKPNANKEEIYFQIGNNLFQSKDYSQAILFYEKALRENYNREDIKFNHKVARAKLGLPVENQVLFTDDWMKKIAYIFSTNQYRWMTIVLAWGLLFIIAFHRFRYIKKYSLIRNLLLGTLLTISTLYATRYYFRTTTVKGIVLKPALTGYTSISMDGSPKPLHQGEKVLITDRIGDKIQVLSESDSSLWISVQDIQVI